MQFRVQVLACVAKPQPKSLNSELLASNCVSTGSRPDLDEGWQTIIMPVFA
jgi:hypothetical protein